MAATPVGTPVMTRATSGSVTGTWGTGQNRTAGDMLYALVSAGGSTASAAAISTPSGWTQVDVIGNTATTANAWVAVYQKIAAGSDAAPAFTATLSGTAAMTCTLVELAGCLNAAPVQAYSTYSSGGSAATLSAMAATTGLNPTGGAYAITIFAQEAAAAVNTWSPAAGWTNLANDGTTSSVLHTAVDWQVPSTSANVSETANWTTDTSAFGAGIVVCICPPAGLELYAANVPSAIVTAGGTDAPAAGTVEVLTVSSSAGFPAASNSILPPGRFHIYDQDAPSEDIEVINQISSTSWLAVRGADGTTPVTHAANWTAQQVVNAGVLGTAPQWYNVRSRRFGATGNGTTDDTAAIQLALTECAASGGGTVLVPAGTYVVSNLLIDTRVTLAGEGDATVLAAKSGTSGYMIALAHPGTTHQVTIANLKLIPDTGTLGGIQLDNTGFTTGDGESDSMHVLDNVYVQDAGGDAFHLDNSIRSLRMTRCLAYGSGGYGIYIGTGCTDSAFVGCISGVSGNHGIYLLGWNNYLASCKAFYAGNSGGTFNTTGCGFEIGTNASFNTLASCSAQTNALHGFDLQSCTSNTLAGCEADANGAGQATGSAGINTNGATSCAVIGCTGGTAGGETQQYGPQVAGTQLNTTFIGNTITGTTGPFGYVSGYGYFIVGYDTADFSNVTTFKLPAGTQVGAGTSSDAPLNLASGTNLTSAAAGAAEYDGVAAYFTNETTSGRGIIPVEQKFRLTSTGGTISTIANFFGSNSNISLVSGAEYEIEIDCWFLNTSSGAVTWTFTNSSAPTSMNIEYKFSPAGGLVTGTTPPTATALFGEQYNLTSAAPTVVSATLTTAVNHHHKFWIRLINGTGTSLKIQATKGTGGTITPGIGSSWKARRVPAANVGTFSA